MIRGEAEGCRQASEPCRSAPPGSGGGSEAGGSALRGGSEPIVVSGIRKDLPPHTFPIDGRVSSGFRIGRIEGLLQLIHGLDELVDELVDHVGGTLLLA